MKKMIKLTLLLTVLSAGIALSASQPNEDYSNAHELMVDFLNPEINPNAPMSYWVDQFRKVLAKKGSAQIVQLKPFLEEFSSAYKLRSPVAFGLAFKKHKDKFGEPDLAKYIEQQLLKPNGLAVLNNTLKSRLSK